MADELVKNVNITTNWTRIPKFTWKMNVSSAGVWSSGILVLSPPTIYISQDQPKRDLYVDLPPSLHHHSSTGKMWGSNLTAVCSKNTRPIPDEIRWGVKDISHLLLFLSTCSIQYGPEYKCTILTLWLSSQDPLLSCCAFTVVRYHKIVLPSH